MRRPARRTVGARRAHLVRAMLQQEAVGLPPQRRLYAALYAQVTAVAGGRAVFSIRLQSLTRRTLR